MAATLTQIARDAGVSVSLVSRFYKNDPRFPISERKRQAIADAATKMGGAQIDRAARSLSTRLAYNVVIPINQACSAYTIEHAMANPFVSVLSESLKTKDFRLSINLFDAEKKMNDINGLFRPRGYCDGLVLTTGVTDKTLAETILAEQIPHISNDPEAEVNGLSTVLVDSMGGLREAVTHLCELGHQRIGFFGPLVSGSRFPQFVAAMVEKGLRIDSGLHCEIPGIDALSLDGYRHFIDNATTSFEQWLDGGCPASALVCQNDDLAMVAVKVMNKRGLEPGRDLSIVGYDNIEQNEAVGSDGQILTTIDNPRDVVGRRCGQRLINQILHGQRDIVHERIPAKLIIRKTTGPCHAKSMNGIIAFSQV